MNATDTEWSKGPVENTAWRSLHGYLLKVWWHYPSRLWAWQLAQRSEPDTCLDSDEGYVSMDAAKRSAEATAFDLHSRSLQAAPDRQ